MFKIQNEVEFKMHHYLSVLKNAGPGMDSVQASCESAGLKVKEDKVNHQEKAQLGTKDRLL